MNEIVDADEVAARREPRNAAENSRTAHSEGMRGEAATAGPAL